MLLRSHPHTGIRSREATWVSPQLRGPLFTELTHRSRPPGAGRKVWGEDPGQAGAWGLPGGGGLEEAREGFTPHPASPPPTAHSGTPPHTPGTAPSQASAALAGLKAPGELSSRPSCPGNHGTGGNPAPGPAPRDCQFSEEQGQSPGRTEGTLCSPRGLQLPDTPQGQIPPGTQAPIQGPPNPCLGVPRVLDGETEASRAEVTE